MDIEAIPTTLGEQDYRSQLEAQWALFFRILGEPFQYEPKKFSFSDGLVYIPDFWLSKRERWIEIKPEEPTPEAYCKLQALARHTKKPCYVIIGFPIVRRFMDPRPGHDGYIWQCGDCGISTPDGQWGYGASVTEKLIHAFGWTNEVDSADAYVHVMRTMGLAAGHVGKVTEIVRKNQEKGVLTHTGEVFSRMRPMNQILRKIFKDICTRHGIDWNKLSQEDPRSCL